MISTPIIQIDHISKSFGNKHILKDFSLDVKKGESLVIIGGSGTGKSVTLKCILGLLTPEEGSIKIFGNETAGLSLSEHEKVNGKIGMLFQGAALFDSLSVIDNVAFALIQGKKYPKKKAYDIALEKLNQVGLSKSIANAYPSDLSGGMKKRVGLARAIASSPDIIFFDEPTTGLDPIMADVINDLIVSCVKKLGATALSITHDMTSVRKIADRVAMLYEGKIIWTGTVDEMDKTDNPYIRQFVEGSSDGPIPVEVV
ncbi:MAG: ABC transporter ATP-binding protein [Alphaproteobacteria bacterium]|nr:ABC transporter ATP-binding protein [Alphaproteobacteria bacterium]NCB50052.1 ABC transporter ATP-binding protein [Alphaproteobacteria bacterium]